MPGTAPRYSHGKRSGATGMLPGILPLHSRVPGNYCFLPGNMTSFWTGTGSMNYYQYCTDRGWGYGAASLEIEDPLCLFPERSVINKS
ncbi:MAG: hypothetical protein ACFFD4_16765 [Candidatus Odinarchaeota archaeon]